jgi:copper resistance protein B
MKRLFLLGFIPVALAATAQTMDHSSMPGMAMPPPAGAKKETPSSKSVSPPPMDHSSMPGMNMPGTVTPETQPGTSPASAMPGMDMPASQAPAMDHSSMPGISMPAAQPAQQDHSTMPGMSMGGAENHAAASAQQIDIPHSPPPLPSSDHAADRYYAPGAMAEARRQLAQEHGGAMFSKVMVNLAEYQIRDGASGYRWDGQAWFGGDINRLVLRSEGEGTVNEAVESAEVQALYSRAVGVYSDIQAGLRQDFNPSGRTYATIGAETLLPYWFEVEGAAFLSNKGELLGRVGGYYDLLLTNYVILQPRAELNFSAKNSSELHLGTGLTNAELGLRLRYEFTREFAPYIGISWDRKVGQTADFSRARGQGTEDTSLVIGIRTFF